MFYLGDCLEGMKELDDKSIDLVVTSPPYNLDIQYSKYKDKKPSEQTLFQRLQNQNYTPLGKKVGIFLTPEAPLNPKIKKKLQFDHFLRKMLKKVDFGPKLRIRGAG